MLTGYYRSVTTPKLGTVWTPAEQAKLFTNAAQGFRSPACVVVVKGTVFICIGVAKPGVTYNIEARLGQRPDTDKSTSAQRLNGALPNAARAALP